MGNDNLKRLHDNLSQKDGFNVPFEQFQTDMQDEGNRQKLWNNLSKKDGFSVPYEQFNSDMGFDTKPVEQPTGPFSPDAITAATNQNVKRWQEENQTPRARQGIDKQKEFDAQQPQEDGSSFEGFGSELWNRAKRGASNLNQMLVNAPNSVLRAVNVPFNYLYEAVGLPVVDPQSFNKMTGLDKVGERIDWNTEAITKNINQLNPKAEKGILEAAKEGDWTTFTRNIAGGVADSFAPSVAMMVGGGSMTAGQMISSGALVFGSGKLDEIDKMAPDMPEGMKILAAGANGALEGIFETYLGSGAVGGAIKKMVEREGAEVAKKTIMQGLREGFSKVLSDRPMLAPFGEGFEEWGTQVSQNYVDKISGYRPDISVFDGATDALLVGIASGLSHSAPMMGVQAGVNAFSGNQQNAEQQQANPVPEEQAQTPTMSPEEQQKQMIVAEATNKLEALRHESGDVITVTDEEGNQLFVKSGDLNDPSNILFVVNEDGSPAGNKGQIKASSVDQNSFARRPFNDALETQLQLIDQGMQQAQEAVSNSVMIDGTRFLPTGEVEDQITLTPIDENGQPTGNSILMPRDQFEAIATEQIAQEEQQTTPEQEQQTVAEEGQPVQQQRTLQTATIGKNNYQFYQNEDGSFEFTVQEGADPVKMEKEIRATLPKEQQNRVELTQEQVTIQPAQPWLQPETKMMTTGIRIKPAEQEGTTTENADGSSTGTRPESSTTPENQLQTPEAQEQPEVDPQVAVNAKHDRLVSLMQGYNALTKFRRSKTNTFQMQQLAGELGYQVATDQQGKMQITNEKGSVIKRIAQRTPKADIEAHRTINEYEGPMFEFMQSIVEYPEFLTGIEVSGILPSQLDKAMNDIANGKKSVNANILLDAMEDMAERGTMYLKADRNTGFQGAEVSIDEFYAYINDQLSQPDYSAALLIPEDVARNINDGKLTPEILHEFERLILPDHAEQQQQRSEESENSERKPDQSVSEVAEQPEPETPSGKENEGTAGQSNPITEQITKLQNKRQSLESEKKKAIDAANSRNGLFGDTKADPNDLFGGQGFDASQAQKIAQDYDSRIAKIDSEIAQLQNAAETGTKEQAGQQEIGQTEESTLDKARKGDKEAQEHFEKYGLSWDKTPIFRFVSKGEVDAILSGERIKGRFEGTGVDVTNKNEPTTATSAEYRVSFNDKQDLDDKQDNSRVRFKNDEDGYISDGYDIDDVQTIEQRQEDGSWKVVYDSSNPEVNQPKDVTTPEPVESKQPTFKEKYQAVLDFFGGMYEDVVDSSPEYIYENVPVVDDREAKQIYDLIKQKFEAEKKKNKEAQTISVNDNVIVTGRNGVKDFEASFRGYQGDKAIVFSMEHGQMAVDRNDIRKPIFGFESKQDQETKPSLEEVFDNAKDRKNIKDAEKEVNTNPTEGQKEAGNYKKGHVTVQGMDISIEQPKGSIRKGTDEDGRAWETEMQNSYGYFKRTEGNDGDHIDVFIGSNPASGTVFVVDQNNPTNGQFDESKVMLGFETAEQAKEAYLSNYEEGWTGFGSITEVPVDQFKAWLYDGAKQNKPFSEYKETPASGQNAETPKKPVNQNKVFTEDAKNAALDRIRKRRGNLNSGINPEDMQDIFIVGGYHVESGIRKFADFAKQMIDDLGDWVKPYLKGAYTNISMYEGFENDVAGEMDDYNSVKSYNLDTLKDVNPNKEQQDVSNRSGNSEPNSQESTDEIPVDNGNVQSQQGPSGEQGNRTEDGNTDQGQTSIESGNNRTSSSVGEQSNQQLPEQEQSTTDDNTGDFDGRGRSITSTTRTGTKSGSGSRNSDYSPTLFDDTSAQLEKQKPSGETKIVSKNLKNIQETLPVLYPEQHDDVLKAENRFDNGKGILFTNGTGTGKTYTGLGIALRSHLAGKSNILIVCPTEKKVLDWIEEGEVVGLPVTQLKDTKDAGQNAVSTTYANFYQNEALLSRQHDLIIYDESHYLGQGQSGIAKENYAAHTKAAMLPSHAKQVASAELASKAPDIKTLPERPSYWAPFEERQAYDEAKASYDKEKKAWDKLVAQRAQELVDGTKVVFLSASPFAYHKTLMYGDGTLFDIYEKLDEEEGRSYGYNEAHGFDAFLTTNFGYRMRYNKPNRPERGIDVGLLERGFFEKMVKEGVFSGRQLKVDQDYSRDFVQVDSELGQKIDEGMKLFSRWDNEDFTERYPILTERAGKKWNYLYINQLLESIKAGQSVQRIQEHLDLGRKVVVFHGYNHALPAHPFHFSVDDLFSKSDMNNPEMTSTILAAQHEIALFEDEHRDLVNMDLGELVNPRVHLMEKFGDRAREFNGTVSNKKKRFEAIKEFNTDNSGVDILIVQRKAGKEGISLHDVSGVHQRALLDLGLPTAPTDAIQTEGRIYRLGVKTNAILEYVVLQTDFERMAYAQKVAERAKTAENLAMGNMARDLETSFKEGYQNAYAVPVSTDQGTGGKEFDSQTLDTSEFEQAKTYYFARGKKNSKNKAQEGIDYFATPEPLGYKIVEWANLRRGERVLEPSAGHGAIGRFLTADTNNTFVEPSYKLSAQLAINVNGEIKQHTFENLHIVNKYDGVVMNPPFGTGGKTAMEHIEKAFGHLYDGGRIVAIIPNGPSMNNRLEKFLYGENDKGKLNNPTAVLRAEITLPSVTFERAGTSVNTKIIVIDKVNDEALRESMYSSTNIDLSNANDIGEFFDRIENLSLPEREYTREIPLDEEEGAEENVKANTPATEVETTGDSILKPVEEYTHTKTGQVLYNVPINGRIENFKAVADIARKHKPYDKRKAHNPYSKGFLFRDRDDAVRFKNEVESGADQIQEKRVSKNGFFSTVENALDNIQQGKGTTQQFKAMLLKNGAKQAELDWMGWDEFSDDKQSVTKGDIQEWIDRNRIDIQEAEKVENSKYSKSDIENARVDDAGSGSWIVSFNNGLEDVEFPLGLADDKNEAYEYALEQVNYDSVNSNLSKPKFGQYVLQGGENYKELLLTMPSSLSFDEWYKQNAELKYGETRKFSELPEEFKDVYRKEFEDRGGSMVPVTGNQEFKSTHYDEPNILAHIRFNERQVNGEKVLFIEELQSDWAQTGRKKGYKSDLAKIQKEYDEVLAESKRLESIAIKALRSKFPHASMNYGIENDEDIKQKYEAYRKVEDYRYELLPKVRNNEGKVPDMPFKQTDQWLNLAFRRMMRYAAENGFDRIAWTTGEQQAERYDLSNHVGRVSVMKARENGKYQLVIEDNYGLEIAEYKGSGKTVTPSEMENIVGKELTQKAIKAADENSGKTYGENKWADFKGEGLKVGGEGMKGFYNQIVPKAANKLGKAFGAKVEPVSIEQNFDQDTEQRITQLYNLDSERGLSESEQSELNKLEQGIGNVLSIPVTEKMKATVEGGMPLFKFRPSLSGLLGNTRQAEVRQTLQDLQDKAPNARPLVMASTAEELESELRKAVPDVEDWQIQRIKDIFEKGGSYGLFDPSTRTVVIDLNNVSSKNAAVGVWLHEMGVHAGLRNILSPKQLKEFTRGVYQFAKQESASDPFFKKLVDKIGRDYADYTDAAKGEEMLSAIGEQMGNAEFNQLPENQRSFFRKVLDYLKGIFNKVFGVDNVSLSRNQLLDIVRASINSNFEPTDPNGNGPKPKFVDDLLESIRQSKVSESELPEWAQEDDTPIDLDEYVGSAAGKRYKEREQVRRTRAEIIEGMREFWMDQNLPIRRWFEEIQRRGGKITDWTKPYRDMRNSFGRMEALYNKFQETQIDPIKEAMVAIIKSGIDSDLMLPYMIAKHGLERNRVMREEALDKWIANEKANDNKPTKKQIDAMREKLSKKDYSGLKPLDEHRLIDKKKLTGVDDLAETIIRNFESKAKQEDVSALWQAVNGATKFTLDTWLKGGQITQKQYNDYRKQYEYFIPLRGWRDDAAKYIRYKNNEGGIGKSLKHKEGRGSLADNPLSYLQTVGFKAISEQVSNEVKQAAFNLVVNNYTDDFKDLHKLKRAYLVEKTQWNEETQQEESVWSLYRDENGNISTPPDEMFKNGEVKTDTNSDHEKLRTVHNAAQHEVVVQQDGKTYVMVFENNVTVAQALNNMNTMAEFFGHVFDARKFGETALFRGMGKVTNYMKGMMTSYNPVFPFTNFFRDQPEAALTQYVRQNMKLPEFATKYTPAAAKAILGKMGGKAYDQELDNFYEAGGTTGFTHEKTPDQLEKGFKRELKRALRKDKFRGKTLDRVTGLLDVVEKWNQLFEDTTRFAVYLHAREQGLTVRDAAFEARNASVDFNMKGKGTGMVESLFAFFKAGANSLQKNFQLAKLNPKKFATVSAGWMLFGFLEAALNDLGDDDSDDKDKYFRLSDYVRHNYLVFHKFWGDKDSYLRIPLPQFWRGFKAFGATLYDLAKGKTAIGKATGEVFTNFIAGMAPVDVSGFVQNGNWNWSPLIPTPAKPIAEVYSNRNFMGNTISREAFTLQLEEQLAESGLGKKNVNQVAKTLTDFLFHVGGGEGDLKFKINKNKKLVYVKNALDYNPSQLEHLATAYTGGVGRFTSDLVTSVIQVANPEQEFDFDNLPFFNSFFRNTPDEIWGVMDEYNQFVKEARDAKTYKDKASANYDTEKLDRYYGSDYGVYKTILDNSDKQLSKIIDTFGFDSEQGKAEMTEVMKNAISEIKQLNK